MEDLLQSQIRESCRLALPNGLKDLMADISREVLRAQPKELYRFIAEYLSVLLIARANLTIASCLCNEVCDCICRLELKEELRNIGLQSDDAERAKTIIMEHFRSGKVNEGSLLMKLMKKTNLNEEVLPSVLEAVRAAFLRHREKNVVSLESTSAKDMEVASRAAANTLLQYNEDTSSEEAYHKAAKMMQPHDKETKSSGRNHVISIRTVSSTSLAGSYLMLPKYKPYSALAVDGVEELEASSKTDYVYIDYLESSTKEENIKIDEEIVIVEELRDDEEIDDSEASVEEIIEVDSQYEYVYEGHGYVEETDENPTVDDIIAEIGSFVSIESMQMV